MEVAVLIHGEQLPKTPLGHFEDGVFYRLVLAVNVPIPRFQVVEST